MTATGNRERILRDPDHKPAPMDLHVQNIPAEMMAQRRWLVWRWEWNGRKWDKPPYQPNGSHAKSTDPQTWCSFHDAVAAMKQGFDGIGFALGDGWAGVDFDDCYYADSQELLRNVDDHLAGLKTYAEYSPSGTGVKALCRGTLPPGGRKSPDGTVEFYDGGRYFTITGNALHGVPLRAHERQAELTALYERLMRRPDEKPHETNGTATHDQGSRGTSKDSAVARSALRALDWKRADNREDWIKVGMVLHDIGDDLFEAWERWSRLSDKYVEGECRRKWDGFNAEGKDCTATLGTLLHWAKADCGWTRERAENQDEPRENRFIAHNITSADLATKSFDVQFLVSKMLVARQPGLVAAPKKGMKTSIMADLGVSLASGLPFLRQFEVIRPCRVAFLSGESGIATLKETALRVCKAAGCELEDLDGLHWNEELPRFERDIDLADLADYIRHFEIEVVIIDPAYMCMDGEKAGNLFSQGTLLRSVARTCLDAGATPIIVHHLKKNIANPFDPPELEDVSWSGFQEFARQWYLICRRQKYVPESGEHALWLNVGSSVGFSYLYAIDIAEGVYGSLAGRYWDVSISRPDEARNDAKERAAEAKAKTAAERAAADMEAGLKRLCELLAKGPDTKRSIGDRAPWGGKRRDRFIAAALDREMIRAVRLKKHTAEYDGFELCT